MAKRIVEADLRGKVKSEFPKHTLDQALAIPGAIEETNGGRPLPPHDVAIAMGISPGGSDFRIKLSSSLKYNLTTGSYKNDRIALTDLGRRIVAPISQEDEHEALSDRQNALAIQPTPKRRNPYQSSTRPNPKILFSRPTLPPLPNFPPPPASNASSDFVHSPAPEPRHA